MLRNFGGRTGLTSVLHCPQKTDIAKIPDNKNTGTTSATAIFSRRGLEVGNFKKKRLKPVLGTPAGLIEQSVFEKKARFFPV